MRRSVLLAALITLTVPAAASAAVTQSDITSPTGPIFARMDLAAPAPTIDVTGTTNGTAGDNVDID